MHNSRSKNVKDITLFSLLLYYLIFHVTYRNILQYLELRFNHGVRVLGSFIFTVSQVGE